MIRLNDELEAVIAQDAERFGGEKTTGELAQRELFDRLGMSSSEWEGESFGSSWHSNIRDIAWVVVARTSQAIVACNWW